MREGLGLQCRTWRTKARMSMNACEAGNTWSQVIRESSFRFRFQKLNASTLKEKLEVV